MWKVYINGEIFSTSDSSGLAIGSPTLNYELNKSASFEFEVPASHPKASTIVPRKSGVEVIRQAVWGNSSDLPITIFRGFVRRVTKTFYGSLRVMCSDRLAYLEDTLQRPARYQGAGSDWETMLDTIIAIHNSQVGSRKRFDNTRTYTSLLEEFDIKTNYDTTMNVLVNTVAKFGGQTWYDAENDTLVAGMRLSPTQPPSGLVSLSPGMNILDLTVDTEMIDLCTRVVPLGAKTGTQTVPGIDDRLTIASVNGGLDYLNSPLTTDYGIITKTIVFDDETDASSLKTRGQNWLDSVQYENMTFQISAAQIIQDKYWPNSFTIGNYYEVNFPAHNINLRLLLSKKSEKLDDPTADKMTFGFADVAPLTEQTASLNLSAAKSVIN